MRGIALILCLVFVIGCQRTQPDYESRYTPPPPPPAAPPPPPPGVSFVDDFERPDTSLGLGDGWDMRNGLGESFPLPPATDGFIRSGAFTFAGNSIVLAARHFRGTVFRVGARGKWKPGPAGAEATAVMGITSNDKLLSDFVQFSATRQGWNILVRRDGGRGRVVATGQFSPPLKVNSQYTFEMTVANPGEVIVNVPGDVHKVRVGTKGLQGDRAYWKLYAKPMEGPVSTVFGFDSAWAAEEGQALWSIPEEAFP